jgi:hypothetical protein
METDVASAAPGSLGDRLTKYAAAHQLRVAVPAARPPGTGSQIGKGDADPRRRFSEHLSASTGEARNGRRRRWSFSGCHICLGIRVAAPTRSSTIGLRPANLHPFLHPPQRIQRDRPSPCITRKRESDRIVRSSARLITRRSRVQIPPPLLERPQNAGPFFDKEGTPTEEFLHPFCTHLTLEPQNSCPPRRSRGIPRRGSRTRRRPLLPPLGQPGAAGYSFGAGVLLVTSS